MKRNSNETPYIIQETAEVNAAGDIVVSRKKIECSEAVSEYYMHERWKEDDQWKRDHYHQETAAEKRMTPEQRYSFDYNPMPKCVSVDSIIDSHGDGNLPYEPDFTEELIELEDQAQKMALLLEALKDLTDEEQQIYQHFYVENRSERDYEKTYGTPRKTIAGRRNKLLERLYKIIDKDMKK